ncbi:hypothetical protein [Proteus terrae]|uniref:hypothetical protein n=1 Tax=Proteus terrae TaxID=1574161 RepID=UPI0028722CA2|nr:hypothetical protein [Proteus terrae]MDR9743066.1 hypothetical protein [Proteus terrae]
MTTPLSPIKNPALEYLKSHPSTQDFHIQTVGQFFTYLKDSILSLFNSDHKFTYLGNKSVAEFNLEHIEKDLGTFLTNPYLISKPTVDALKYSFNYLQNQSYITLNLHDIYRSGSLEPNDLISQLINYSNKLHQQKLSTTEAQHAQLVMKILGEVNSHLKQLPNTENLTSRISSILNN